MDPNLTIVSNALNYGPYEVVINMSLAFCFGLILSWVYRSTHKGLSYSQSFTLTIIFVTVIVAIVMMVIGSSLARAFALVGALSIIRFRTVMKDTKDTAYVFAGLSVGLAAGTNNYFVAAAGTAFISGMAFLLHKTNYGALYKSEFILRFTFSRAFGSSAYLEKIAEFSNRSNLLHVEPAGDGDAVRLTYDIVLREGKKPDDLAGDIGKIEGSDDVVLIASKTDVDY